MSLILKFIFRACLSRSDLQSPHEYATTIMKMRTFERDEVLHQIAKHWDSDLLLDDGSLAEFFETPNSARAFLGPTLFHILKGSSLEAVGIPIIPAALTMIP